MFKSIWNIAQTLIGSNIQLQQQRVEAEQIARLSMDILLPRWLKAINSIPSSPQGVLRPPPPEAAVFSAEERLHVSLPPELVVFYSLCNGVDPVDNDFPYVLTPIESLRRCGEHVSPLSGQMRAYWKEAGYQAQGYSPAFAVYPSRLLAEGDDEAEGELSFMITDQMLALETPRQGRALVMVIDPRSANYPAGTVLEVEALAAVRYPSLSAWMAEKIIEASKS